MRKIQPIVYNPPMAMESREIYPRLHMELKDLPEAKKWKVGESYRVLVEVKLTGLSLRENGEGESEGCADFNITGVEVQKMPKENYRELPDKE